MPLVFLTHVGATRSPSFIYSPTSTDNIACSELAANLFGVQFY